jgi:hypothetical protein
MPYKDRTAGLIAFGVLTILLGIGVIGLNVLMLVSQGLIPKDQSLGWGALLPSMLAYAIIGVALIVLGVGSIRARRWARALLLVFSATWLAVGVMEMVAMSIILPSVMTNAVAASHPPGNSLDPMRGVEIALFFTFGFLGFIFILLPGIWTFFYYSPHVRATCEVRDPNPSWTDGLPAALLSVCFAAAWALGGWLNFRLDIRGWWLLVIVILLGTISSVLTFCFHSIADLYRAGNYPPAIIDQMSKLSFFNGPAFAWLMGLVMLPFLGYLIFIRRYFVAR